MNCPNCTALMDREEATRRELLEGRAALLPLLLYRCPDCGTEGEKTPRGRLKITHDEKPVDAVLRGRW